MARGVARFRGARVKINYMRLIVALPFILMLVKSLGLMYIGSGPEC